MQEALDDPYGVVVGKRRLQRIMNENGWLQRSKRKPNGLTRADKAAQKSDNLLGGDFTAERPHEKVVTDMTEVPAKDGKLYVSAAFDCYDQTCVGLAMGTSMKTDLVLRMYEPCLPRSLTETRHSEEHEQRQWTLLRSRNMRIHVGTVQGREDLPHGYHILHESPAKV